MKVLSKAKYTEITPDGSERRYQVRIHEVNHHSLFPVKFTYDYPGYKTIIFHDRKSRFSELSDNIIGW